MSKAQKFETARPHKCAQDGMCLEKKSQAYNCAEKRQRNGRQAQTARQRDWAAEGVTWAEGHMGICRSHVSLSRGHLWLLPMLYVRFVQEPFRKVSGKRVRKVSGMSGFMKRCHGRHRMHVGDQGACCHAISHPRKPPWIPMKPFLCISYAIMFLCDSFLPSFASRRAP